MIKHTRTLVAASALGAIFWAGAVMAQAPGEGEMPPPAVTVVTLKAEDVTLTATLPGRVVASAEAELRPQVNGLVLERLFDEGSVVEQGQPL